jgi:hypothetical protein
MPEKVDDLRMQYHKQIYQKIADNPFGRDTVREHARDLVLIIEELQELRKHAPASHR